MVFWKSKPSASTPARSDMELDDESHNDADEPPDELLFKKNGVSSPRLHSSLARPQQPRRESLLTRQLYSETEQTDDDVPLPRRAYSTISTSSNPSSTSAAELTSDDGRSLASPNISPPFRPVDFGTRRLDSQKNLDQQVKIVGNDDLNVSPPKQANPEKSVEAGLGRKRCITFACKGKQEAKIESKPAPVTSSAELPAPSPPKRRCMLKFVCPTRSGSESKRAEKGQAKRSTSPAPPLSAVPPPASKAHRGSDSTVTHVSPRNVIRDSSVTEASTTTSDKEDSKLARSTYDSGSDSDDDATMFHEFAVAHEPEEWIKEPTNHLNRLTVNDTLRKEIDIRKQCQEAEEEAVEEEEAIEEDDEELEEDDDNEDLDGNDAVFENDEESDEGFHSDDEEGFASSDDDESDAGSDLGWWRPGGLSTAATSVEQLDRMTSMTSQWAHSSSAGSGSSAQISSRVPLRKHHKHGVRNATSAMPIKRPDEDLPDSTDFVCGTLDEDKPLEQAYLNRKKLRQAAKHKPRPQDIDPSFPTSDPEMDEEDDEDLDDGSQSEHEVLVHGELEDLDNKSPATIRHPLSKPRRGSPAPMPAAKPSASPSPTKRRSICRSPPPPSKRGTARSPPPRKLFAQSPRRRRSPAPQYRMTSPANSPNDPRGNMLQRGLAARPQPMQTASLPRSGLFAAGPLSTFPASDAEDDDGSETAGTATTAMEMPRRGAIDIVKGLEQKRQRRKEKLHQKQCAKAAAKGGKEHKVKPGKGVQCMREIGLNLQNYRGTAEHILSM